jgi:hypothetical protein
LQTVYQIDMIAPPAEQRSSLIGWSTALSFPSHQARFDYRPLAC